VCTTNGSVLASSTLVANGVIALVLLLLVALAFFGCATRFQ
jgi:hypothetical protein